MNTKWPKALILIKFLGVIFLLAVFLITSQVMAQPGTIRGTVGDAETGEALAGANVLVQGRNIGTATNTAGEYSFRIPAGIYSIRASFVGYRQSIVEVDVQPGEEISLNFELEPGAELGDVQVVGTRMYNRSILRSPVPVDIIALPQMFEVSPQTDINQLLTYVAPSFQANRQSSADQTEFVDPASFRGLGPDQVLVLVNGKRRHNTSLVNTVTFAAGYVGTDLNSIPYSAIERIEILRDGAAAQYGSDAIAGVINIVLKQDTDQLTADVSYGGMSRGDGETVQFSANYGFRLGANGFVNIAGEFTDRGRTIRSDHHDLCIFAPCFAYPFTANPDSVRAYDDAQIAQRGLTRDDFGFRVGDSALQDGGLMVNALLPVSDETEVYAFGGLNFREGIGAPFRRLPGEARNIDAIYPVGFQPETQTSISDQSIAIGVRSRIGRFNVDLSNTYGKNRFDMSVGNTLNASLLEASPTRFEAGGHSFSQNTTNLDFTRLYGDVLSGLNIAFGAFFRVDNFRIFAGEEGSWRNYGMVEAVNEDGFIITVDTLGLPGGSQGFPGFSPANEVNQYRQNAGAYFDSEVDVTEQLTFAGALRFENYSDFGNTLNGKLAARIGLTDWLSVRGSVSTGFRAPALHQMFFNNITTNIVDGRLMEIGLFKNDSNAARVLGIEQLKEETSQSFTLGFTARPTPQLTLAVDGYLIDVDDRVVLTGNLGRNPFGGLLPEVAGILEPIGVSAARLFANAVDTRTQGVDIIAAYNGLRIGRGFTNIALSVNITETDILRINMPPQLLGSEDVFFGPKQQVGMMHNIPNDKVILTLDHRIDRFSAFVRLTRFGKVARSEFPFGTTQWFSIQYVTDLTVSYRFTPQVMLTVGGNNIFDEFPDRAIFENSFFNVFDFPPVQQGFNGSYFFGRLTINM